MLCGIIHRIDADFVDKRVINCFNPRPRAHNVEDWMSTGTHSKCCAN